MKTFSDGWYYFWRVFTQPLPFFFGFLMAFMVCRDGMELLEAAAKFAWGFIP